MLRCYSKTGDFGGMCFRLRHVWASSCFLASLILLNDLVRRSKRTRYHKHSEQRQFEWYVRAVQMHSALHSPRRYLLFRDSPSEPQQHHPEILNQKEMIPLMLLYLLQTPLLIIWLHHYSAPDIGRCPLMKTGRLFCSHPDQAEHVPTFSPGEWHYPERPADVEQPSMWEQTVCSTPGRGGFWRGGLWGVL